MDDKVSFLPFQVHLMKDKDGRTKLMNEILNGIKVLKLYAWESSFIKEVMKIRSKELKSLRAQAYLNGAITFAFSSVPYLVSFHFKNYQIKFCLRLIIFIACFLFVFSALCIKVN